VWPVLHYDDTNTAGRFLMDAFGFRDPIAVRDDDGDVIHAELRWAAGARLRSSRPPHETTFGSRVPMRAVTAHHPEVNPWTFGEYRGAP
jgi:uncharacterized glyoxalase superfamily protein PhnB